MVTSVGLSASPFLYLYNAWTYCNETHRNYSIAGRHDTNDIFKVTGSKGQAVASLGGGRNVWKPESVLAQARAKLRKQKVP